jgi:hypothetical protein
MKKWQLEGILCRITSPKLALPDPNHTVCNRYALRSQLQKESRIVSVCRSVVAFFIKFF